MGKGARRGGGKVRVGSTNPPIDGDEIGPPPPHRIRPIETWANGKAGGNGESAWKPGLHPERPWPRKAQQHANESQITAESLNGSPSQNVDENWKHLRVNRVKIALIPP